MVEKEGEEEGVGGGARAGSVYDGYSTFADKGEYNSVCLKTIYVTWKKRCLYHIYSTLEFTH